MEIKITKIQIFLISPLFTIAFPSKTTGINKKDKPIQGTGSFKLGI